jgi:hypothetical protein
VRGLRRKPETRTGITVAIQFFQALHQLAVGLVELELEGAGLQPAAVQVALAVGLEIITKTFLRLLVVRAHLAKAMMAVVALIMLIPALVVAVLALLGETAHLLVVVLGGTERLTA